MELDPRFSPGWREIYLDYIWERILPLRLFTKSFLSAVRLVLFLIFVQAPLSFFLMLLFFSSLLSVGALFIFTMPTAFALFIYNNIFARILNFKKVNPFIFLKWADITFDYAPDYLFARLDKLMDKMFLYIEKTGVLWDSCLLSLSKKKHRKTLFTRKRRRF